MDAAQKTIHLSDPDLLRHVDREGDDTEHARRDAHLRGCTACADRLAALRAQSGAVSAWLTRADLPRNPATPPVRRRSATAATPWLRAAAIILLLAAPLAALPPVREWIADRVVGSSGDHDTPATTAEAAAWDQPVVRFSPAPGTFTVRVVGMGHAGTLTIGRSEGSDAVLRAAGAPGPPVVADDLLRLTAGATSAEARYELRVPESVDAVRVVGGERVVMVRGRTLLAGTTLTLRADPVSPPR